MNIKLIEIQELDKDTVDSYISLWDESFQEYLGFDLSDKNLYDTLLKESIGDCHKYWFVYYNDTYVGLFYYYDYTETYKTCGIGYGLLSEFRSRGFSEEIFLYCCNKLLDLGIVRIEATVELTNVPCLRFIKHIKEFEYEGLARNKWGRGVNCKVYSMISKE